MQSERGCDLEGGLHDGHDRCLTEGESTGAGRNFSGKHLLSLIMSHLVDSSKPSCTIRSPTPAPSLKSKPLTGAPGCKLLSPPIKAPAGVSRLVAGERPRRAH